MKLSMPNWHSLHAPIFPRRGVGALVDRVVQARHLERIYLQHQLRRDVAPIRPNSLHVSAEVGIVAQELDRHPIVLLSWRARNLL